MAPPRRLTALIGLLLASPAAAQAPAPLLAHRVVYELSLARTDGTKAPVHARGRIAFEFSGSACEGYVQTFRQITELQPAEGVTRLSDMRSATFEGGEAKDFRFKIETKIDSVSAENIDGKARKSADGALAIELTKPKPATHERGGPVFFPTEHLRRVVEAARAGQTMLEAKVFDGSSDGAKVFDTLAVIGKAATAEAPEAVTRIDAMKAVARWPVSISYFEPGKADGAPSYTLSFELYENGVSRALLLDYGDFALRGEMRELTALPASTCKK